MTIDDIKRIIGKGEDRHLELKKTTGELKDGMHTACAFLNGEGGWLIFGITPNSLQIVGQMVNDNTQRELAQALSGLSPAVTVAPQYIDVPDHPGNQVIAIYFDAFAWGKMPYTYQGCPYYKVESTTKVMPSEMFADRIRTHKPSYYAWEQQEAMGVTIDKLDEQLIRGALRLGFDKGRVHATALTEPLDVVLGKLDLLTDDGKPNNAAAALFSTTTKGYTQFRLRMARFRGTDKNEFIDNQRVDGNFFKLLDAGMDFFLKHLSMSGKIVGFRREESLEVPAPALREALTNALCHRQFEKYNLTPSIAIFDDRIEIENPGILPPLITPETIKGPHNSYPYNPIMADVLFKSTILENWGTGAKRIMDVCLQYGVPEPTWNLNGGFVCVTFRRERMSIPSEKDPTSRSENEKKEPTSAEKEPTLVAEDGKKDPTFAEKEPTSVVENGEKEPTSAEKEPTSSEKERKNASYEPSSKQIKKLIFSITDGYVTMGDMMKLCGLKSRFRFRLNYLLPALEEGAVESKYPENANHPDQQYRLTGKALKWKNSNG